MLDVDQSIAELRRLGAEDVRYEGRRTWLFSQCGDRCQLEQLDSGVWVMRVQQPWSGDFVPGREHDSIAAAWEGLFLHDEHLR